MKKEIGEIEATPSKRLFLSIIADYDLNRAICELIDNALDVATRRRSEEAVFVNIVLDEQQQHILIADNAGGVKKSELSYIVGPGQSGSVDDAPTIGIFGVGTKRAIVALSQQIRIQTRYGDGKTYQIEIDDEWLEKANDWSLPLYEASQISQGETIVSLQKLRQKLTSKNIDHLKSHLSATYASFLQEGRLKLNVNETDIFPRFFDDWSYPPEYEPRNYLGKIKVGSDDFLKVSVTVGLSSESSPATGEYGVYFYCNGRLIARALKTRDVGFSKGHAGIPHPKISLTKAIVRIDGSPRHMPWNSSKSDIDTKSEVFSAIQDWLIQVVSEYAAVSRNWQGDWPDKVFQHKVGSVRPVKIKKFSEAKTTYLPPAPRARFTLEERAEEANKAVVREKPWSKGVYEGVIAADIILKKKNLEHRDRVALILIDSSIEIAFKEYLVNESGQYYNDKALSEIFKTKNKLFSEMRKFISLDDFEWKQLGYYADVRNKIIHQRATVGISASDIESFRGLAARILDKLFGLRVDV